MPTSPRAPWTIPLREGPLAPWTDRAFALLFAGLAIAVVVLLAPVVPDARGHGTHEQLGMAPCSWPIDYHKPCPTCGCTTAASLVVHGRLWAAIVTQPFGAVFTMALLLLGVHALCCLVARRSFADLMVRLPFWRLVLFSVLLLLGSWCYLWWTWPG